MFEVLSNESRYSGIPLLNTECDWGPMSHLSFFHLCSWAFLLFSAGLCCFPQGLQKVCSESYNQEMRSTE